MRAAAWAFSSLHFLLGFPLPLPHTRVRWAHNSDVVLHGFPLNVSLMSSTVLEKRFALLSPVQVWRRRQAEYSGNENVQWQQGKHFLGWLTWVCVPLGENTYCMLTAYHGHPVPICWSFCELRHPCTMLAEESLAQVYLHPRNVSACFVYVSWFLSPSRLWWHSSWHSIWCVSYCLWKLEMGVNIWAQCVLDQHGGNASQCQMTTLLPSTWSRNLYSCLQCCVHAWPKLAWSRNMPTAHVRLCVMKKCSLSLWCRVLCLTCLWSTWRLSR